MHIGFLIPGLHGGGAEFVTRQWIGELVRRGHDVTAYTFSPKAGEDDASLLPAGVRVTPFRSRSRLLKAQGLPLWLRRRATEDRLDVLVAMMTYANIAAVVGLRTVKALPCPVVISERNLATAALQYQGEVVGSGARAKRLLASAVYRRADAVMAISHPVAGDLVGGYRVAPGRVTVVPNPVLDLGAPDAAPAIPAALHLVFVGRLVRQKRPELVLDTVAELRARGVDARVTYLGKGPEQEPLERRAREAGVPAAFPGWHEPWWGAVPDADCLVLPSLVEGFGNVLVEATAQRIPVVAASGALGTADAVVPGLTGELAVGDTAAEYADAVLRAAAPTPPDPVDGWLRHFSVHHSTSALLQVLERARAGA